MENKLESELDDALEWQQRVSLAKFKWTNARVLLIHSCTQMAFGIKRWKELEQIDLGNTRMRYFAAAEARNNFIAAGQNVQSARVYLGKVQFPYCSTSESNEIFFIFRQIFKFTSIFLGNISWNFQKFARRYPEIHFSSICFEKFPRKFRKNDFREKFSSSPNCFGNLENFRGNFQSLAVLLEISANTS